ncbi:GTPase family protein [Anaeropeptidivorans aminofermentans]|uniref:GTPase family protein n=1 Tax=Anaeropeptidivorans aminofermentans TaxID=2934315 RepID=UPI00202449FB|nr:GTPase [Anaeropeptidivorans aminofermentans]
MQNKDNLFKRLNINMTEKQKNLIINRLTYILNYEPKIGILGKTGVGKSSLCNALFGKELFSISDVKACTRNIKEGFLKIGNSKGIKLIDVPGVGESRNRDEEYAELYAKLMPELDLVLWVIKADDRALASDESFYKNIVRSHIQEGKPFFFVLNQVDKIEPFREWDNRRHIPSPAQFQNINVKVLELSRFFEVPASAIICVSASERYNLTELVNEIIFALPNERKITFYKEVGPEFQSEVAGEYVKKGFLEIAGDIIVEVLEVTGEAIVKVKDTVADIAEKLLEGVEENAPAIMRGFIRKFISWL